MTGTIATTARARPGCWVTVAPMSRPPLEPPRIASRSLVVRCDSIRKRAQQAKSSKTFCLAASRPAWCQCSPYSPPPLVCATATTPPCSSQGSQPGSNRGLREMP